MSDNERYRFQIEQGLVTAIEEFDDGRWSFDSIDANESYAVDGDIVVKTEIEGARESITRYLDDDGDGVYLKLDSDDSDWDADHDGSDSDDSYGDRETDGWGELDDSEDDHGPSDDAYYDRESHDRYVFDVQGDAVVAKYELEHGVQQLESIDNSVFSISEGVITEKEIYGNGYELTEYQDLDGDGFYTEMAEQWVSGEPSQGSSSQALYPLAYMLNEALEFEGADGDDFIRLQDSDTSHGGAGADQFVYRELGDVVISDFNAQEGDRLVFDTGYGLQSADDVAQYVTDVHHQDDTLSLEFGDHGSIIIIGIAASDVSWDLVDVLS